MYQNDSTLTHWGGCHHCLDTTVAEQGTSLSLCPLDAFSILISPPQPKDSYFCFLIDNSRSTSSFFSDMWL